MILFRSALAFAVFSSGASTYGEEFHFLQKPLKPRKTLSDQVSTPPEHTEWIELPRQQLNFNPDPVPPIGLFDASPENRFLAPAFCNCNVPPLTIHFKDYEKLTNAYYTYKADADSDANTLGFSAASTSKEDAPRRPDNWGLGLTATGNSFIPSLTMGLPKPTKDQLQDHRFLKWLLHNADRSVTVDSFGRAELDSQRSNDGASFTLSVFEDPHSRECGCRLQLEVRELRKLFNRDPN